MKFKASTFVKGLIWEALGVVMLFIYTILATGSFDDAITVGVGYPAIRVIMWYPYERLFKQVKRNGRIAGQHEPNGFNRFQCCLCKLWYTKTYKVRLSDGVVKGNVCTQCLDEEIHLKVLKHSNQGKGQDK